MACCRDATRIAGRNVAGIAAGGACNQLAPLRGGLPGSPWRRFFALIIPQRQLTSAPRPPPCLVCRAWCSNYAVALNGHRAKKLRRERRRTARQCYSFDAEFRNRFQRSDKRAGIRARCSSSGRIRRIGTTLITCRVHWRQGGRLRASVRAASRSLSRCGLHAPPCALRD